ncbi:MAG TPA: hypothetical protein DCE41_11865 [Cytophagales bacterium]|nr:hypothetical protein [Cytophagales bacterium]
MNSDQTPNEEPSQVPEEQGPGSRREFFKKSALGLGGLALVSGSTAGLAQTTTETTDAESAQEDPTRPTAIPWNTPPEIDVTNAITDKQYLKTLNKQKFLKSLKLTPCVDFSYLPIHLMVDDNINGQTPAERSGLYGFNGTVPGPTLRVSGDQDLEICLWNQLPGNNAPFAWRNGSRTVHGNKRVPEGTLDWQLQEHLYGPHQQNVTNLHTHGLHISPGVFKETFRETAEEVQSDNVLLRVVPVEDYDNRAVKGKGPTMKSNEIVGFARYKFKLKIKDEDPDKDAKEYPHFSGTHWYHPHPHGATFDQVAGGMAGFLLVEGKVDQYLADTFQKHDYQELPMLLQRVIGPAPQSQNQVAPVKGNQKKVSVISPLVNGQFVGDGKILPTADVFANQVLRIRLLNGSVDGNGYVRFFIRKNYKQPELINPNQPLYKNRKPGGKTPLNASAAAKLWYKDEAHEDALPLLNMAYDGIQLMDDEGVYADMAIEWLTVGVANRADFLIAIPADAKENDSYTVWAQQMIEAVDSRGNVTYTTTNSEDIDKEKQANTRNVKDINTALGQFVVRKRKIDKKDAPLPPPPTRDDGVLMVDWKVEEYPDNIVHPILKPISDEDIQITSDDEYTNTEMTDATNLQGDPIPWQHKNNAGKVRARRLLYSGWGDASIWGAAYSPTLQDNAGNLLANPTVKGLFNAMLIDGKKYGAEIMQSGEKKGARNSEYGWDAAQHTMLRDTAEEWTVYNYSMTAFMKKLEKDQEDPGNTDPNNYVLGVPAYKNANGSKIPGLDKHKQQMMVRAVHHPFHIHQNPFYLTSVQDAEGNELLPLDKNGNPIPRWQDTVYIPHNGGRAIFRSRFLNYTGRYVNHCHLLQHEDWGMMQAVQVVSKKEEQEVNYLPLPPKDTNRQNIFPGLSLAQMFKLNVGKVKQTLTQESLKMLCYHKDEKDFFDQKKLTDLEAIIPPPPTPPATDKYFQMRLASGATANKNLAEMDKTNMGKLIIPVPEEEEPFPQWNNDLKRGNIRET